MWLWLCTTLTPAQQLHAAGMVGGTLGAHAVIAVIISVVINIVGFTSGCYQPAVTFHGHASDCWRLCPVLRPQLVAFVNCGTGSSGLRRCLDGVWHHNCMFLCLMKALAVV